MLDRLRRKFPEIAIDALAVAGAAAVVHGVSLIYLPAAYIVGGLAAIGLAVIWSAR